MHADRVPKRRGAETKGLAQLALTKASTNRHKRCQTGQGHDTPNGCTVQTQEHKL
jgi:hypothetical protein